MPTEALMSTDREEVLFYYLTKDKGWGGGILYIYSTVKYKDITLLLSSYWGWVGWEGGETCTFSPNNESVLKKVLGDIVYACSRFDYLV